VLVRTEQGPNATGRCVERRRSCYSDSMGARTSSREAALQMLFGIEATSATPETAIQNFWREFEADPEGRAYADEIVRGVVASFEQVDQLIRTSSTNWRLERMARVDRNLLRLAAWELLSRPDVPRAVILDEAVELAKRYGGEESGAFVNGVLDRLAEECGRVDHDRSAPSES
jgi:transcription antitermination protein NusB